MKNKILIFLLLLFMCSDCMDDIFDTIETVAAVSCSVTGAKVVSVTCKDGKVEQCNNGTCSNCSNHGGVSSYNCTL